MLHFPGPAAARKREAEERRQLAVVLAEDIGTRRFRAKRQWGREYVLVAAP